MGSGRRWWLIALGVLLPLQALAEEPDAALSAPLPPEQPAALHRLGVMIDAGVPDGADAAVVFRPLRWLRADLGGGYNLVSAAVLGGVTVLPFGWGPSATIEGGHYFDGNANGVAQRFAGASFHSDVLDRVGYDFFNAQVGVDFGYRRLTFFVHGGMSYVQARIHNVNSLLSSAASSEASDLGQTGSSTQVSLGQDPTVHAWFPSAKLGLIVYLW